jgi:hypothetical protein
MKTEHAKRLDKQDQKSSVLWADAGTATERDRQYRRLPEHLRPVVFPARSGP